MSRRLIRIIWIDDSPDERSVEARNLDSRINTRTSFINVEDQVTEEVIRDEVLTMEEPDLILMDHSLDRSDSDFFKKGSTAAALIHERWPTCPIICITAVDSHEVDSRQRSEYIELIPFEDISSFDQKFLTIAKGFRKLKANYPRNPQDILRMLKAPQEDYDKILAILPTQLKGESLSDTSLLELWRWLNNIFFERPGLLYDELWTATLLGVKPDSFHKIESLFTSTRYKGVFANDDEPRWWKSKVVGKLAEITQEPGMPWKIGRLLQGLKEGDFSICHVTDEDFPDTVAFVDETPNAEREQMKLRETKPHSRYQDMLFYEELRVMKGLGEE